MFCAQVIAAVDVVYPLLSKIALDEYLPSGMYGAFFIIVFGSLLAYIVRSIFTYVVTFIGHQTGVRIEADMRRDIFTHIQKLPFSFYDKTRTGFLLSRCTNDLIDVTELAHHGPEDLFISIVTFLGAFAVMLTIEWRLALILMAFVPVMIFFVILLRKRMSTASHRVKEGIAIINAGIESSISGARVAKAFANEYYDFEIFNRGNSRFVSSKKVYYKAMGIFMGGMELFTSILKVVVLGLGGILIMSNSMDMVALLTFSLYVTSFVSPIRKLAMFAETYTMGMSGFARFIEIMDTDPDIEDIKNARPLKNVNGDIAFKNVSFSYDGEIDVIKNVSINIKAGKKLALVGPSGGGKTTICHLIPRFYEPTEGKTLIDGRDYRERSQIWLQKSLGYVLQQPHLFSGTIRDNIAYGRKEASLDEIRRAAQMVHAEGFILKQENGYDTEVGEGGVRLSTGEKQLISFARVVLADPRIFVLDEATSSIDTETEQLIQNAITTVLKDRTSFIVAHRLSTIRNADRILVIRNGRITEEGTHGELLKLKGYYYELYTTQFKEEASSGILNAAIEQK